MSTVFLIGSVMTCGEAYKKIIMAWQAGKSKESIAKMMRVSVRYVNDAIRWYDRRGEELFRSTHPFKGTKNNIPDERAIYANHRRDEILKQRAAREMVAYRNCLRVGDHIVIHREEGQGFCRVIRATEITVQYIGRDYVVGVTDRGIKESQSIHELWKWGHDNMKDWMIEAAEELQRTAGITFEQALMIIQNSKVVSAENWGAWITDIRRAIGG